MALGIPGSISANDNYRLVERWLEKKMESTKNAPSFNINHKRRILEKLRGLLSGATIGDLRFKAGTW